jgi:hypothetical protein
MKQVNLALIVLALAGCAGTHTEQAPPEHLIGKYAYQGKGTLAKHPWSVNAALVLERDAQYTLDLRLNVDDDDEHETSYGTYRVQDDKLILDPADGSDHDEFNEFMIQDNRLVPKLGWGAKLALKGLKLNPVFVKAE